MEVFYNCSTDFGYGKISDMIMSESYCFDITDFDKAYRDFAIKITDLSIGKNIYLYKTHRENYPVSFLYRNGYFSEKRNSKYVNWEEKTKDFSTHRLIYGLYQIEDNIDESVCSLKDDFLNSYIIISDIEFEYFKNTYEKYQNLDSHLFGVYFNQLINEIANGYFSCVITITIGNEIGYINFFKKK